MNDDVKEHYIVSSLVRGFQILSTFTPKRPELKVSEIAELTGFDQATVFRFVYTLEKIGYLVRDEDTKRYHQSVRMLTLSLPARMGFPVREISLPYMFEVSHKLNEIVTLVVLDGLEVVTIATAEIPEKIVFSTSIGLRQPVYCTAAGKVILAHQPVETWDRLIPRIEFKAYTDKTIVDPEQFRLELMKIRQQGYATQDSEFMISLGSIATPIFNHARNAIAAINVSALSMQILDKTRVDAYAQELLKTAWAISSQMGYAP